MKAVIMAGGQGSRLRPLTCDTPKPLSTLLGRPIIRYILDLLRRHGIDEAAVTLGYQGLRLEAALQDYDELPITFSREEQPLGTAGGVRFAVECLGEPGEALLVISGDAMCDFDLTAALDFHRRHNADATILTYRVDDPREYGLVQTDAAGRVTAFVEKPSFAGCVTDLANTGIYILSPAALGLIEPNRSVDFARDIFPQMLTEGMAVYGWEATGYWCDIGDLASYLRCQADMLSGKVHFDYPTEKAGIYGECRHPSGQYTLRPPVYIGRDVSIGEDSIIGPNTVLEDDVRIGSGCVVEDSILHAGVTLADQVTLEGMIACENAAFEDGSFVGENSAVGAGGLVGREAVLASGVRVWPGKTVEPGTRLMDDLLRGHARELVIGDEGISGQTNVTVTPAFCTQLGSGIASLEDFPLVGVGYGGRSGSRSSMNAAQMLALSCMSGLMAAGASVWDFGECIESQFEFCLGKSQVDFGVYIDSGMTTEIRVTQRGGLPLRREYERKLESAVNRREYKRAAPDGTGSRAELWNLSKLYPFELLKLCDVPLDGIRVTVKSTSKVAREVLEEVLTRLGCQLGGELVIQLAPDGKSASMSEGGVHLSAERLLAVVCLSEFLKGECVALPRSAPRIIDRLAEQHGGEVFRYSECPCDEGDEGSRQKASSHPWPRDGLMQAVKALSFLAEQGLSFADMARLVPEFAVSSRMVEITSRPSAVVRRLRERLGQEGGKMSDGLDWERDGSGAYLRPMKSGRGILILGESFQNETALEICDWLESAVKDAVRDMEGGASQH